MIKSGRALFVGGAAGSPLVPGVPVIPLHPELREALVRCASKPTTQTARLFCPSAAAQ
jgi:hypothetical protein